MKVAKMPPNRNEPSRLELYKAGKLEERHSPRPSLIPSKEAEVTEEDSGGIKLRAELIAIALMVIVLLILAAIGF